MKAFLCNEAGMLARLLYGRASPFRFLVNLSFLAFLWKVLLSQQSLSVLISLLQSLRPFVTSFPEYASVGLVIFVLFCYALFFFTDLKKPPGCEYYGLGLHRMDYIEYIFGNGGEIYGDELAVASTDHAGKGNYIGNGGSSYGDELAVASIDDGTGNYIGGASNSTNDRKKIIALISIASTDNNNGTCSDYSYRNAQLHKEKEKEKIERTAPSIIDLIDQTNDKGMNQLQFVPMDGLNTSSPRRIISRRTACNHIYNRHYYHARRCRLTCDTSPSGCHYSICGYGGCRSFPCSCLSDQYFTDFISKQFARMKEETSRHESHESGNNIRPGIPLLMV